MIFTNTYPFKSFFFKGLKFLHTDRQENFEENKELESFEWIVFNIKPVMNHISTSVFHGSYRVNALSHRGTQGTRALKEPQC